MTSYADQRRRHWLTDAGLAVLNAPPPAVELPPPGARRIRWVLTEAGREVLDRDPSSSARDGSSGAAAGSR